MTKTKVMDLEKLCNLVTDIFFHLKSFIQGKLWPNFLTFKIQIFSNDLGGRNNQNRSCRDLKKL
jgi:hypothetical protein